MTIVTRFAPSPTGRLHLGHVHSAAFAKERAQDGCFLVRFEDIDPQRCRPEYAAWAAEDLRWLGFLAGDSFRRQSEHIPEYRAVLTGLEARGLVYPCFCSRADIRREAEASASAPHTPDGAPRYPGTCRNLPAEERRRRLHENVPHAWRLDMERARRAAPVLRFHDEMLGWIDADPSPFGDVLLGRRDSPVSYHLCATHDDALQGVTLVTRGEDLRPAAHLHVLLQTLMGWPVPAYAHHRLLAGPDGTRLSKRNGAEPVGALRAAGWRPADVIALAASRAGQPAAPAGGFRAGAESHIIARPDRPPSGAV